MKKLLILGGNGFAGRNLREYLSAFSAEYIIDAPSSSELNLLDEIKVHDWLACGSYDVVVNAAIANQRRSSFAVNHSELECDLRMFCNLERCSDLYGKMLYFGSGAEYDKRFPICSVKESDIGKSIPTTDYGFAKYIIGKYIEKSENIYNLRIFGLYGKYEDYGTTFISGACCKALMGIPISIRQNVFFDYLYIDDFCRIVKHFVDSDPGYRTYNVTSGTRVDLITLAETVKRISGVDVPIYVCRSGLTNEYTADNSRMRDELGSFIFTDAERGIASLLKYYKSIKKQIDIMKLLYQ